MTGPADEPLPGAGDGSVTVVRRSAAGRGRPLRLADLGVLLMDAYRAGLPADTALTGRAGGWRGRLRSIEATAVPGVPGAGSGHRPPLPEAVATAVGALAAAPELAGGAGVYALLAHLERSGHVIVPQRLLKYLRHLPGGRASSAGAGWRGGGTRADAPPGGRPDRP